MRVRDFMRLVRGFVGVRAEGAVAQTLSIFKRSNNLLLVFAAVGRRAGIWMRRRMVPRYTNRARRDCPATMESFLSFFAAKD
jgi:hypothetical protein